MTRSTQMPARRPAGLTLEGTLPMFVIYERPIDAPSHYVTRRWNIVSGGEAVPELTASYATTLREARAALPRTGLINVGRMPDDDPKIVEAWV